MKFRKSQNPFKKSNSGKNSRIKNFFYRIGHFSAIKQILIAYFFITLIGGLILFSRVSQNNNDVSFMDSLFTSASAFSDTGLVTKITVKTWSFFGQAVIAILILMGGIGFFALKVFIINYFLGRKTSLVSRNAVNAERGTTTTGETKSLIKTSVTAILIVSFLSSIALTIYFYFVEGNFSSEDIDLNPKGNFVKSLRYGIFHSISAINNAGFDIMSSESIKPYYFNYGIQIIFVVLFVLGGIGYPVIKDVFDYFKSKKNRKSFHFSLFTKLSMITYFLVVVIGLSIAFSFEVTSSNTNSLWNNKDMATFGNKSNRSMAIVFNTLSTRNAGFGSFDLRVLTPPTKFLFSIMMFIGSAPASTAGGIRTTTLAIIVLSIYSSLLGRKSTRIFNRRIKSDTVKNSALVVLMGMFLVLVGIFITYTSVGYNGLDTLSDKNVPKFTLIDVIFEVTSAFGTTGLSTGLTPIINIPTKMVLILIMFIGQLGISTTIFVWARKKSYVNHYDYVEEDVTIG